MTNSVPDQKPIRWRAVMGTLDSIETRTQSGIVRRVKFIGTFTRSASQQRIDFLRRHKQALKDAQRSRADF